MEIHSPLTGLTSSTASMKDHMTGFAVNWDMCGSSAVAVAFCGISEMSWSWNSKQGAITCAKFVQVSP